MNTDHELVQAVVPAETRTSSNYRVLNEPEPLNRAERRRQKRQTGGFGAPRGHVVTAAPALSREGGNVAREAIATWHLTHFEGRVPLSTTEKAYWDAWSAGSRSAGRWKEVAQHLKTICDNQHLCLTTDQDVLTAPAVFDAAIARIGKAQEALKALGFIGDN